MGDLSTPVFLRAKFHGMDGKLNINLCKFDKWVDLTEDLRFMILMDGIHPAMDTCILIDYKGHLSFSFSQEKFFSNVLEIISQFVSTRPFMTL